MVKALFNEVCPSMTRSYFSFRIEDKNCGISLFLKDCHGCFRHWRWRVGMMFFTAGCQDATSEKLFSITQSNDKSGKMRLASVIAGRAWMRSPMEVSLTNKARMAVSSKDLRQFAFQRGGEAMSNIMFVHSGLPDEIIELQ